MNNNPLGNFADEMGEAAVDAAKDVVREAKKQIVDKGDGTKDQKIDDGKKKVDPVTNKPIPTKKVLTQLNQATAQLAQTKLKKIREELDKQRLKISEKRLADSGEFKNKPKLEDDAVAATLRNAKSTGEMGRNVGG